MARLAERDAQLAVALGVIKQLTARVEYLERRLGNTSQNSSRPPSSDPPSAPMRPASKPSGRKPGGQPGHKGHRRELLPPDKVDHFEDCWPPACGSCEHALPFAVAT